MLYNVMMVVEEMIGYTKRMEGDMRRKKKWNEAWVVDEKMVRWKEI
jgi:hypothetical protein